MREGAEAEEAAHLGVEGQLVRRGVTRVPRAQRHPVLVAEGLQHRAIKALHQASQALKVSAC